MIETLKSEILQLLRDSGEPANNADSFTFTRLGEGRGFSSLLWNLQIGNRIYAVKITDTVSRVEEIAKMVSLKGEQKADFARLFGEQHNRELQVYEWLKYRGVHNIPQFYAGSKCHDGKPGIIIMESLADSESTLRSDEGLTLNTVLDIVYIICEYQAAYNFPDYATVDLIPKDLFFEMASPTYKKCVEKVAEKGWMREEWKSALLSWCELSELKRIQTTGEDGDPALTLAHCDLWANNLIFGRSKEGVVHLKSIIDWQCAAIGHALLDVSSVVGINMDGEERRKHEGTIISQYVEEITEKCAFTHVKSLFSIDLKQAQILYRRGLKFAAIQLSLTLGTHCKDETQERVLTGRLKAILEDIVE
ncbi:hypothetical protein PENTCL1PPCAC_14145 [Pristionchus entomophagus]|uniref:CHK kinase-like domain-containing protein n=1 Tax=Pristionchus entomophagus TaxID=358040 RepID=A0AAV5T8R2_9BILA|nr:hypothetical protein PENTCL1PPCAC_14145 [Pristionchus entomophagus]